ncbi:hypothetical protein JMA_39320 (plasmid) [Jeotgalibacillus malaysiensis]|uniref:Uncharacterized protein n=1 Tax=Jeotgalibacillus malaysiensis TaxID=1508404 RepID=A0A0B5ASR8_9BACL|nr:hypothetical protein [Jeotgalibacillus malaysiensis]AJD93250.1 hypothetical protein JMA_39320 [Jeotgalibacillus malaysiensis]
MPKLFNISYTNDFVTDSYLTTGDKSDAVKEREMKKLESMCKHLMEVHVKEVKTVDGFAVQLLSE